MEEVRGAVERVDDPHGATVPACQLLLDRFVTFFREDHVIRMVRFDHRERRGLGVEVCLRHVVGPGLDGRSGQEDRAGVPSMDLRGRFGGFARSAQEWIHGCVWLPST